VELHQIKKEKLPKEIRLQKLREQAITELNSLSKIDEIIHKNKNLLNKP